MNVGNQCELLRECFIYGLSSNRLNDKGCNKAELHSLKNCIRRDICELQHQRRQRQR